MKITIFTRRSLMIFILLFIVISLTTMKIGSTADGNNLIGFPFRFYEFLGGKRNPEPITRNIFNYSNLIIDIVIIGLTSILIDNLLRIKIKTFN